MEGAGGRAFGGGEWTGAIGELPQTDGSRECHKKAGAFCCFGVPPSFSGFVEAC